MRKSSEAARLNKAYNVHGVVHKNGENVAVAPATSIGQRSANTMKGIEKAHLQPATLLFAVLPGPGPLGTSLVRCDQSCDVNM